MTRLRKLMTGTAGTMLVVAGLSAGVVGTAAPAQANGSVGVLAHPTGCSYDTIGDYGATATCDNHNGGSFRATAVCTDRDNGEVTWGYGPWKQHGISLAYCQGDSVVTDAGIMTSPRNNT